MRIEVKGSMEDTALYVFENIFPKAFKDFEWAKKMDYSKVFDEDDEFLMTVHDDMTNGVFYDMDNRLEKYLTKNSKKLFPNGLSPVGTDEYEDTVLDAIGLFIIDEINTDMDDYYDDWEERYDELGYRSDPALKHFANDLQYELGNIGWTEDVQVVAK